MSSEKHEDFYIDKEFSAIIEDGEVVDDEPEVAESNESSTKLSDWQQNWRKRLLSDDKPAAETTPAKQRRRNCCFNCLGDHNIANCTEPKDFAKIRKNRNEFMNSNSQNRSSRISHTPQQAAASKFRPGRMSQELREALRLGPDDIPEHVYRMRRLGFHKGYPPAYLKKALIKNHIGDTLKFIISDDDVDDGDEETRPAPTVDHNKIHFYMGFNKQYSALRDVERGIFAVPSFETFCDILQEGVTKQHNHDETLRVIESRVKQEKKKAEASEIPEEELFVIDTKKMENTTKEETSEMDETVLMGESMSMIVGTPVIQNELVIPSLEAFSVGIVPFEAKEEEVGERGTFKKIMNLIRDKKL